VNAPEEQFLKCEFSLLRYIPDPIRGEFVNIGVILREIASPKKNTVSMTRDWSRVLCLDPDADIELFQQLEREIRAGQKMSNDQFLTIEFFLESHSNCIQITNPVRCLAASKQLELRNLMRLHVETRVAPISAGKGRAAIHRRLRKKLKEDGLLDKIRQRIPTSPYTSPGDPMRLDYGFRKRGVMRLFHAVSLEDELQTAKALAYSMPSIRKGVLRVENATLDMTAVVEPFDKLYGGSNKEDRMRMYTFAIETMRRQHIRVLTTDNLQELNARPS
jgi:hypothetical protein